MLGRLAQPVDWERRMAVGILVAARWLLVVISALVVNYRQDVGNAALAGIDALILAGALLNLILHLAYRRGSVPLGLALGAGLYDAAAIIASMGIVDGFRSSNYILLYPALLAFALVFPGRPSIAFTAQTLAAYTAVVTTSHHSFRSGNALDQKQLLMRLATLAATVYVANIVARVERVRRQRAVEQEAERSAQVLVLERRAHAAEQAVAEERRRLSQEVHDGVSQDAYMLSLGLETLQAALEQQRPAELRERVDALLHVARQTLLESRSLLFDLDGAMRGEVGLGPLLRSQAADFEAVTGIAVACTVSGAEQPLPPAAVAELYRIVHEALANVFRHACARNASVGLTVEGDRTRLEVSDDGCGFEPAAVTRGRGLANIRSRAARLGGTVELDAQPGRGTHLMVEIPSLSVADEKD